jgi:hypothetical protein
MKITDAADTSDGYKEVPVFANAMMGPTQNTKFAFDVVPGSAKVEGDTTVVTLHREG